MKLCKITCLINSGLFIGDLSVHLSGKGDSAVVAHDSVLVSKDVKKFSKSIRIEPIIIEKSMPVWPFIKSKRAMESKNTEKTIPNIEVQGRNLEQILNQVQNLDQNMKSILSILINNMDGVKLNNNIVKVDRSVAREEDEEPLFIPNQIVHKPDEVHVTIAEGEANNRDFEASQEALRKIRKAK